MGKRFTKDDGDSPGMLETHQGCGRDSPVMWKILIRDGKILTRKVEETHQK